MSEQNASTGILFSEEERRAFESNVTQLRVDSFRIILLLTLIVGWVWFSWAAWPRSHHYSLFYSDVWVLSLLLVGLVAASFVLHLRHLHSAMVVFVMGLVGLLTALAAQVGTAEVAYLYAIPLVFASVLLGQSALVVVGALVGLMIAVIGVGTVGLGIAQLAPVIITLALTAMVTWTATHNMQVTLAWTLNGYREAHKNELLARESKANLALALKSLDNALAKLRRANERLSQVTLEAEEARHVKQQFAQTISHELRTPLNLIVGFAETMIKSPEYYGGPLPPSYLRDLSVVYRNACHLQNLVNDVLDLARLEAAYLTLHPEPLDIAGLIQDATDVARSLVARRGLALHIDVAPDLPQVVGDAVRLKQVILNLLNNAARFTEQGSITVAARADDSHVIVSVTDTGIGIPAGERAHIFEAFRQLENPMQRRNEGAGLGLAISQQLIQQHGGQIWVESEVGRGSTFSFKLPVKQVDTITPERPLDSTVAAPARTGAQQKRLILVVTRSPSSAALLSNYLTGYRVLAMSSLEQARLAAQQYVPQVVIVDTATADVDPALVRAQFTADLSVRAVITCPLPGEEPLRQRVAADGYLIKPITRESLWDVLRQFREDYERVLVVDDDRDFVRLVSRMLTNPVRPYNIMYAYSGSEALEIIKYSPPDIVLLDLNLPDMDGAQVTQAIRADPQFNAMRVVVVTAYSDFDSGGLLDGVMTIAAGDGLRPQAIVQWLQAILAQV